uniref:Gypsy retrotransposon integrase-like protein 1 n=1 Tax=Leptobrachium leishanense TaxID=445787 RepID=A0A8C5QD11_9ANUR
MLLYTDLVLVDKEEEMKVKLFLYLIGDKGREVKDTLLPGVAAPSLTVLMKAFDDYCQPKQNETVERYNFFSRSQREEEGIDAYVTELRTLAATCNFGNIRDSLIRDRIICGTRDSNLRERLLREVDLTLDKCLQIGRAAELSTERVKLLERSSTGAVSVHGMETSYTLRKSPRRMAETPHKIIQCIYCGKRHEKLKEKCPAFGKQCKGCGKANHFINQCRASLHQQRKPAVQAVYKETADSEEYEDILGLTLEPAFQICALKKSTSKFSSALFATMLIDQQAVRFQMDCGADCNVLPARMVKDQSKILPCDKILRMYNKSTLTPVGICKLKIRNPCNQKLYQAEFVVIDSELCHPILGSRAIQAMDLISVQHQNILTVEQDSKQSDSAMWGWSTINKEYADIFQGVGCLEGKLKLEVDALVQPVRLPKRKVPVSLLKPLQEELASLEKQGIITPVERSTDWISSMVIVKKPSGKLRICIDPKPLNKALKRSHYPLPTLDDILPDLARARIFSVCDVKSGFWHIELEEDSSYLTTFSTPFGRYRWVRMPMGISPAPEVFQRKLNHALEGLPGIRVIADDILIVGEGETDVEAIKDHDQKLRKLLDRCRERQLKLNPEKFQLRKTEVPYIGHLLSAQGLQADPSKVKAITEMPRPTDVKGVQRFLGMVNYLSRFCENISDAGEPLRQLTQKDAVWEWTEVQEGAFQQIKSKISCAPVLKYYNPEEPLELQCDASERGLGAALMQSKQPLAFASRALTETEQGYAQIEKELLAVLFGMEKFHQFTFGQTVAVQSDHKPLESIMKKPLLKAPRRLQRMMLRLQMYDACIRYCPGKSLAVADTLSRAYLDEGSVEGSVEHQIETVNMLQYLPISNRRLDAIQKSTDKDKTLQAVKHIVLRGWPHAKELVPLEASPFYHIRDELSVQDGVLFKGERVVIPSELRSDIMSRIHSSHFGVEGCLRRARESVYWPGMNAQLKEYIDQCDICRSFDTKQQKETLMPHEIPTRPWEKIGTDLFTFHGHEYLITVDYDSNFWEIDQIQDTRSTTVIRKLKAHFARYGIPDTVCSDNGPQFISMEFKEFSMNWDFDHITSSPGYPQSNGKVESAVKTAKRLLQKAVSSGNDPYLALLDHRNTPTQGLECSPAQRLMGRRTKSLLPMRGSLLMKDHGMNDRHQILCTKQRALQAAQYNRGAKDLRPLNVGEQVWVQPPINQGKEWRKACLRAPAGIRSYEVVTESGQVLRRNRRHLRGTGRYRPQIRTQSSNQEEYDTDETNQPSIANTPEEDQEEPHCEISDTERLGDDTNVLREQPQGYRNTQTRSGRSILKPAYLNDYVD